MDFLRLAHAKTMDKPKDYNKETMEVLAKRYKESAQATNETRANNLRPNSRAGSCTHLRSNAEYSLP